MERKKTSFLLILLILLSIIEFNCSENQIYSSDIEIPGNVWNSDKAAVFKPELNDTLQLFDISLSVSNSSDYRYNNIWFFIKSLSPDGYLHIDTLEVLLSENDGKWIGKKSDDLYTLHFNYKKQVRFPKIGKYTFEIIQGMRDMELKGINRIGFEIKEAK